MSSLTRKEQRQLRRAQRLQRLINREGNGMRIEFFTVGAPSPEDTPVIDMDETPQDIDADEGEDDGTFNTQ